MANILFSDVISGKIELNNIEKWLLGKDAQVINGSVSRTDFTMVLLKHIQEETNKFLPASRPLSSTHVNPRSSQSPHEKLQINKQNENEYKSEDGSKNQRTPFQVINKVTSTRTSTQLSRQLNDENELKRDSLQGFLAPDNRNISTSTPVITRRSNSRNSQFPISPPNSFHSDQSSLSHTPRSSKSPKYNSSPFSPSSPQTPSFSPSSPQYSESFPDLNAKSHQKRAPQSPCLGDFITIKPASLKNRKRIKPTLLSTPEKDAATGSKRENQISFGSISRPFVPLPSLPTEVQEQLNFDEERSLLKQKRTQNLKSLQDKSTNDLSFNQSNTINYIDDKEQDLANLNHSLCSNASGEKTVHYLEISPQNVKCDLVDPDPKLVTSIEKIIRLASVYSTCLDANLVPNFTLEIYNVFTLLTARYREKAPTSVSSPKRIISTDIIENSVNSGYCNNLLERLCLTERSNDLTTFSNAEMLSKGQIETKNVLCSVHDCVMFSAYVIDKQVHTIQCFDKGTIRLLCENPRLSLFLPELIPRLIKAAELKDPKDTNISTFSGNGILDGNRPVLYHSETDNKDNFSSLENFNCFKKQRDGFYEILHEWKSKNSDNIWVLKRFPQRVQTLLSLSRDPLNMMHLARLFCSQMTSIKCEPDEDLELVGVSRNKLSRLQARISKPATSGGCPRPPPNFPAEQQFYQQFLQLSVGSTFLQHVTDCLVYRLRLLDHTDFFVDGLSFEESKSQIMGCVSSTCLIAKFVGLIVFLPYTSNSPLSPDTLQAQIMVRDQMVPPVNLVPELQRALVSNRLVVSVPWLVAFLGMMDPVAPYLASYRPLLHLMVSIYKALPLPHLSHQANLLLRCSLGWLFDVTFFPQHVFFSLFSNCDRLEVISLEAQDVDLRDVVDQALLYEVCPYLTNLQQLLISRQGTSRHITPVSAQLSPTTQTTLAQTIELQLEECFLSGQSTSFRSTVDVIVDRISSSCIKYICSNIILSAKERANEELKFCKEVLNNPTKHEVQVWIAEQCHKTEAEVDSSVAEHCGSKIETALRNLLGPDLADPVLCHTTQAICARRCRERCIKWLNSHIKLEEIFSKLIPGPDSKSTDLIKPCKVRQDEEHLDSAMTPADMIIQLQDKICECIESRSSVLSEGEVVDLINRVYETITHRNDLMSPAEHTIFTLTIDLCIVLLAHSPATVTVPVVSRLCALWSICGPHARSVLERIMSARNTMLLCQAGASRARESWQRLSLVLVKLLTHSPPLLTPGQLETQCVALLRLDWPPMVLSLMGACLSSMLQKIKEDSICKHRPKFVLMLEWVNEMTEDLSKEDGFED